MNGRLQLGGMALRNGLLVHGPTQWAAAIRASDGSVRVAGGPRPRLAALTGVPGARGVGAMAEALAILPAVRRALPEARLPFESPGVAGMAAGVVAAGLALRRLGLAGEASAGVLSLLPAVLALRGGDLAGYHGAEHKAIGGYERGGEAEHAGREHERCGSHLVAPLLASHLAGTALLRRAAGRPVPLAGGALAVASLGLAVEVMAWTERHPGSRAAQALRAPGDALQRSIGTREPDDSQLEVAGAALAEVLRAERATVR